MSRRPDIPPDLAAVSTDVSVPSRATRELAEGERPCGPGRYAWRWERSAPVPADAVDEPISVYCEAAAICMTTGRCAGPRFVPHYPQPHPSDGPGRSSPIRLREAVMASRYAAARAARVTGVRDTRRDQEVADRIRETVAYARTEVGSGGWGPVQ